MENEGTVIIERPMTPEEEAERAAWEAGAYERAVAEVDSQRLAGYQTISDPKFFEYQRGECTQQDWLDAVQSVKDLYPYPVQGEDV